MLIKSLGILRYQRSKRQLRPTYVLLTNFRQFKLMMLSLVKLLIDALFSFYLFDVGTPADDLG